MRFTWGHASIAIPVIIVVVFTSVLIRSMADDKKTELVTEDYYAQEIQFQDQIDHTKNALILKTDLLWKREGDQWILGLNGDFAPGELTGELTVYRPSDSNLDFKVPILLNEKGQMSIPNARFKNGKYQIQVKWNVAGKDCYLEKNIFIQ
tara:strand:+ start:34614 stop:35063 length:450 start_codon:yes stop_codon:yes gene_type:complete